jgi:DNA-binding response OmpR family regulator
LLPGLDGLSLLRDLRGAGDRTPALVLSALGDVDERIPSALSTRAGVRSPAPRRSRSRLSPSRPGSIRSRTGDRTPALVLSALGDVDERIRGLRAGGDDYLAKPFVPSRPGSIRSRMIASQGSARARAAPSGPVATQSTA